MRHSTVFACIALLAALTAGAAAAATNGPQHGLPRHLMAPGDQLLFPTGSAGGAGKPLATSTRQPDVSSSGSAGRVQRDTSRVVDIKPTTTTNTIKEDAPKVVTMPTTPKIDKEDVVVKAPNTPKVPIMPEMPKEEKVPKTNTPKDDTPKAPPKEPEPKEPKCEKRDIKGNCVPKPDPEPKPECDKRDIKGNCLPKPDPEPKPCEKDGKGKCVEPPKPCEKDSKGNCVEPPKPCEKDSKGKCVEPCKFTLCWDGRCSENGNCGIVPPPKCPSGETHVGNKCYKPPVWNGCDKDEFNFCKPRTWTCKDKCHPRVVKCKKQSASKVEIIFVTVEEEKCDDLLDDWYLWLSEDGYCVITVIEEAKCPCSDCWKPEHGIERCPCKVELPVFYTFGRR